MTVSSLAGGPDAKISSASDRTAASELRRAIAANASGMATLRVSNGTKWSAVALTPALSELLMALLAHVARGDAVRILAIDRELTTRQAADMLNVSRPFLVSLLEKGDIPYSLVGRHRRIAIDDLLSYKERRDARRNAALSTLAELDGGLL